MQGDAGVVLLGLQQPAAEMDAVGADALLHRAEQDHLQVAAMDRQLRCVIAGETPARLAEGELAMPVVEAHLLRSEEHTSELQSLMRISYAVFCLQKKKKKNTTTT